MRLYQSIYETALRNQVPRPVIDDLIRIYSYDVDFQRKVQPGDSFEVLFAGEDENASDGSKSEVLFASLTTAARPRSSIASRRPTTASSTTTTRPARARRSSWCASRSADGIMRSGFGSRNHPILGYTKMHTGVDWAAPMGTPIFASGNGTVEKAGWEGGYGKYIRIRHANGYETAYGHMSAFARGMEPGKRVRQGQVIGYVGSTGLSTGAHLHYEILVNGRFVDPMSIKLPRGRVLEGPVLAGFEQENATAARRHDDAARPAQRHRADAGGKRSRTDASRRRPRNVADSSDVRERRIVDPIARFARPSSRAITPPPRRLPLKVSPACRPRSTTFSPSLTAPGEDQLGERVLHRLLDHALERARAIGRVPALVGEPVARRRLERDRDLAILQQLLQPRASGCRRCVPISLRSAAGGTG